MGINQEFTQKDAFQSPVPSYHKPPHLGNNWVPAQMGFWLRPLHAVFLY